MTATTGSPAGMRESLLEIARSGVLAPSADNQHVFRIELGQSSLRLWPTPEFAEGTPRHRRVLGLISLGAVVENMRLRASELGFGVTANWFASGSNGPIVDLELHTDAPVPIDDLAQAIAHRRTNRRMYHGPVLSDTELDQLGAAIGEVPGIGVVWLRGDARRQALSLIWRAESERFLRKPLHDELFASIRFDLSWQEGASVRLPPGALEVEAPMRPIFKALRHWPLMRPLTWLGTHRLLGLRAGWLPCWQAPALGLIAAPTPEELLMIRAGATLQRLWLRATLMKLAFQPLAASTVLALDSGGEAGTSAVLRSELEKGWRVVARGATPVLVFRIGRAAPPTATSSRLPLESYLRPSR